MAKHRRKRYTLTVEEVMQFLRDIENGKVTLTSQFEPKERAYCGGNVDYVASNGWLIRVFNDAGRWDYLDEIQRGSSIMRNSDMDGTEVARYRPTADVAWRCYGIPGKGVTRDDSWPGWTGTKSCLCG